MRGGGGRTPCALLIVVLAGLGTANILVRTAPYGAGVGPDSIAFLSTAMNFLAGEGWRAFAGSPLTGWPPLFPLLLAAGGWVGIDPLEAGRLLNATAFGLTILAAGGWLRSHLRAQWLTLVATATITASLPLSNWATHFMTDPLFVLWTLLALIQLAAFLNRGERTALLWTAGLTALAALTRYPGVALVGVGVLVLLVRRAPPLGVRLKDAVVFGAISSLPLAGVLTRNWAVSGTLTGRKSGAGQSPSDSLSQVVDVFRGWVVSPHAPDWLGYILWTAAGLVVVLAGLGLGMGGSKGTDRPASPFFGLGPALPFGVFAVSYIAFMVVVVPFTVYQIIDSRYLLPIYVPLLLTGVLLLDRFLSIEAGAIRYGLAALVVLAALAHIGFSARENLRLTAQGQVAGFGYNAARWHHSETMNYIRDHHIEGRIFSNQTPLAWFANRIVAPNKHHDLAPWVKRIEAGEHIILFREFLNRELYGHNLMDIRILPGVEPVAELADGVVFRATATVVEPFNAKRQRPHKQRYVQQLLEQAGEHMIRADSTWPISTWGAERAGTDEQVARAGWDVYRNGRKLTYRKQPCAPDDVQTIFLLQVSPVDPEDLSADRQPSGFDNLDFYFLDFYFRMRGGIRLDDQCVATAQLPDYPISRIYIGRWLDGDNRMLWEMELPANQ